MNVQEKYDAKNIDTRWDHRKTSYDLEKFNWPKIFLDVVCEKYPHVDNLTLLHEYLEIDELINVRKHVENFTRSMEFCTLSDQFVSEIINDRYDHEEYLVQITPGIRLVVPNQIDHNRLLNFHTGYWTGYDNGTATIWTPITEAYDSNTMQVTDWDTSRELMQKIHDQEWSLDKIQSECEKVSYPIEVKVGESWLFSQGHLHGNVNNTTGKSRMSFDIRITHKGINFGRRRPGSFYREPFNYNNLTENKIDRDKKWLVFVSPNDEYINMAPYFMIREFLLQWCKSKGIIVTEWSNEYHDCNWMPKLKDFLSREGNGIVLPSIYNFSLPIDQRIELFEQALENNVQLIFVDENIVLDSKKDIELIKKYYDFYYSTNL